MMPRPLAAVAFLVVLPCCLSAADDGTPSPGNGGAPAAGRVP